MSKQLIQNPFELNPIFQVVRTLLSVPLLLSSKLILQSNLKSLKIIL